MKRIQVWVSNKINEKDMVDYYNNLLDEEEEKLDYEDIDEEYLNIAVTDYISEFYDTNIDYENSKYSWLDLDENVEVEDILISEGMDSIEDNLDINGFGRSLLVELQDQEIYKLKFIFFLMDGEGTEDITIHKKGNLTYIGEINILT